MAEKLTVCWISAGVSSFVAGWLARDHVDRYLYIDISDQHPDSMRFIHDCENALGKPIEILRSEFSSVGEVCRKYRFIASAFGAKCTTVLKKEVRKKWEQEHVAYDITYVWGMDADEKHRADRIVDTMFEFQHEFPLIEHKLTKADAHGILFNLGIRRPAMYEMGYQNNNCVGCLKGGMGYWNRIRRDFPAVFSDRAAMEREIGHSIIPGTFLDQLPPHAGKFQEEIPEECSLFCAMTYAEAEQIQLVFEKV